MPRMKHNEKNSFQFHSFIIFLIIQLFFSSIFRILSYFDSSNLHPKYYIVPDCLLFQEEYFAKRIENIRFLEDYSHIYRNAQFSIIVATKDRYPCIENLLFRLIKFRPNNTEIIICDDKSEDPSQNQFLRTAASKYKNDNVFILQHRSTSTAFHSKLDGFLFSVGKYIMSIDDDDDFNDGYFQELAEHCNETLYDFVVAIHQKTLNWIYRSYPSINSMIQYFHNHYIFAFRRALLSNVNYPSFEIPIVRDDAPLMVPLYLKTTINRVLYFNNSAQYLYLSLCNNNQSQSLEMRYNIEYSLNGYYFLAKYVTEHNRSETLLFIKCSYVFLNNKTHKYITFN